MLPTYPKLHRLLLLLILGWLVAANHSEAAQAIVVKHPATGKQREQLLQLRSIVAKALQASAHADGRAPSSAIDSELPVAERSGNLTGREPRRWWRSQPFFIGSILAGCVAIAILALLCIACTPICSCFDCRLRKSGDEKSGLLKDSTDDDGDRQAGVTDCPSAYGVIRYQLKYNQSTERLEAVVKGCSDLPKNPAGTLNPFVSVRIVDRSGAASLGEAEVTSTPVANKTTSPEFDFPCRIKLPKSDLAKAVVLFEVFDREESSKEPNLVARCRHKLQDRRKRHEIDDLLDPSAVDEREFRCRLKRGSTDGVPGPGEICVLLRRDADPESPLLVRVIECKGVHLRLSDGQPDKRKLPNTYVELTLTEPQGQIHAQRSDAVSKCRNPYFNQEFSFPAMPTDRLRECALRLTLVHVSDFLRSKRAIGSVELSVDEEADVVDRRFQLAREHWLAVVEAGEQQQPVSKCSWHCLIEPDEELQLRRARAMQKQ